jgi:hypothetical protein
MFKYVVAALAAGAEAQSRFRGRRRRNRRFSTNQALFTNGTGSTDPVGIGMTEYARAVYVNKKAYGVAPAGSPTAYFTAIKENEGVKGLIIAEAADTTAGTAIVTTDVYAHFSNLANTATAAKVATYTLSIIEATNLKLWKCEYTDINAPIQAATPLVPLDQALATTDGYRLNTGVIGRANSKDQAVLKLAAVTGMDIKTQGTVSATTAANGRRQFRGGRWRPTGEQAGTLAMNVNYVVELRAEDVAATATPVTIVGAPVIIGCGVFRPYNEESFKKDIEDVFIGLTAANNIAAAAAAVYPTAAQGNTAQVLNEMKANQGINRQDDGATPPVLSNVTGQASGTPGVTLFDMATTTPVAGVTPTPALTNSPPVTIV